MKTTSRAVQVLEEVWAGIRRQHPELPYVQMTIGSGENSRGVLEKLGHFSHLRWHNEGKQVPEILLAGEALKSKPADLLEVLLHEGAHALGAVRGIQNTSRQGRYHNKAFAKLAAEMGLEASPMGPYGLAQTILLPKTEAAYGPELGRLGDTFVDLWRLPSRALRVRSRAEEVGEEDGDAEGDDGQDDGKKSRVLKITCGCERPRIARIARSTFELGPISCGVCGSEFELVG